LADDLLTESLLHPSSIQCVTEDLVVSTMSIGIRKHFCTSNPPLRQLGCGGLSARSTQPPHPIRCHISRSTCQIEVAYIKNNFNG